MAVEEVVRSQLVGHQLLFVERGHDEGTGAGLDERTGVLHAVAER
ncbi:MAG: hypothetical protein U0P45_12510 [Acidimicrobiales bacterium]